jgi:predicted RNA-binding Zn ribbon-like protein
MAMPPIHDLPERLDLPLTTGEPWWYWLGGRPALDLVNTLRERWRRQVETLVTPTDLARWLERAGVTVAPVVPDEPLLGEARALREAIDACVGAALAERPAQPADVAVIDAWLAHAAVRPQLEVGPHDQPILGERPGSDPVRAALGAVALDAAHMLGRPAERARMRICASETCSARFYDRSPAGRRRWCSMRSCGNEAKARRHRERAKAGA